MKKLALANGDYRDCMPEAYRPYYDMANKAMEKAKELKKKKDEMQLKLIGKAVEPIWKMKDTENLGYITKEQCCEIA